MAGFTSTTHWRDSARSARFFVLDYRASFPLLLWLLHIAWWTFFLAVGAMIFFWILEYYGFTVPVFLRLIRTFFAGRRKMAAPWWKE